MRVHRTLIILAFILSFFVQTDALSAAQSDADLQALTTNLTVKAKGVLEQGEENIKKAVDTLSQKKFILKNQAAVIVAESEAAAAAQTPKIGLWKKMIHAIAEPLIPLFTPRDVVFKNNVMQVAQVTPVASAPIAATVVEADVVKAPAPAPKPQAVVATPRVVAPQIYNRTVVQNVSASAIQKLRAEMILLNEATRAYARDLEDRKVDSLAQSLDRNLNSVVQQVTNVTNINNVGGGLSFSETVNGLDYAGGVLSTTAGYAIPLTASTSEWGTFYQTPSTRITAGANCSWVGNVFNCAGGSGSGATTTINGADGPVFAFNPGTTGTDFNIATSAGTVTFNIPTASAAARGLLGTLDYARIPATASSTNWNSFYDTPSSRITAGANLAWVGNTLGFNGILSIANGGTGTSTTPTYGKLLMGNASGTYDLVATTSLGITGGGSGTVNSGTTGQLAYYGANGAAVSGTSNIFMNGSNIGIGTASPSGKLDVRGDQYWGTTRKFYLLPDWAGFGELGNGSLLGSYGVGSGSFSFFPSINGGDAGAKVTMGYSSNGGLNVYSALEVANVASGFSNLVLMKTGGNVGIGTTSPYAKLSVVGTIVGANFVGTTTATSTLGGGLDIASGCFAVNGTCISAGGGSGTVGSGTTGQVPYYAAGGTTLTGTSSLFITAAGTLGIGTTSTAGALMVNKDIGSLAQFQRQNTTASFSQIDIVQPGGAQSIGDGFSLIALGSSYAGVGAFAPDGAFLGANGGLSEGFSIGTLHASAPIKFFTGGSAAVNERMRITSTGNVGIGTTSPAYALAVAGDINYTGGIYKNGVLQTPSTVGSGTTGQVPYYAGAGTTLTATSSLFITTAGTVGIGTTSAAGALMVNMDTGSLAQFQRQSTTASYSQIDLVQPGGNVNTNGDTLSIVSLGDTYTTSGALTADTALVHANAGVSGGLSLIARHGSAPIRFYTGGITAANERMRITSTGNVGIGITNPTEPLEVNYTDATGALVGFRIKNLSTHVSASYAGIDVQAQNAAVQANFTAVPTSGTALSGGGALFRTITNHKIGFSTNDIVRMVLDTNGNLGVGTTSPYAKLSVAGTIVGANFVGTTTATSTLGGGLNIATGCFAVNGTCISAGGGSGTVGSGTTGQVPYYAAGGTTLSATSTLFINTAGNVGVGTTTVENVAGWGRVLQVYGTASSKSLVTTNTINGGMYVNDSNFFGSSAGMYVGAQTNHPLVLVANSQSVLTVTTGSKIGIGTSTPTSKLMVRGDGLTTGVAFQTTNSSNAAQFTVLDNGTVGVGTSSPENSAGWGRVLGLYGSGSAKSTVMTDTVNGGMYANDAAIYGSPAGMLSGTQSNHPLSFMTNSLNRMTITTAGNVGIGTTTPAYALQIRKDQNAGTVMMVQNNTTGSGAFAQSMYNTSSDSLQVGISSNTYTVSGGAELFGQNTAWLVGSSAGGMNMVASNASGVIRFGTGGYAAANERMRITATGLVGIGTTTPANALSFAHGGIRGWNQNAGGIQIMNSLASNNSVIAGFANNTASDYSLFNVMRPGGATDSGDFQFYALGPSYASSGLFTSSTVLAAARSNFTGGLKIGSQGGDVSLFSGGIAATDIGLTVTTGKNVGVGTTTPNALMHIYRTTPVANDNFKYIQLGLANVGHGITDFVPTTTFGSIGPTDTAYGGMYLAGYVDDAVPAITIDGYSAVAPSAVNTAITVRGWKKSGTGRTALTGTEGLFSVSAGSSERLRITADGNVGIGTTSPYAKLSVVGTIVAANFVGTTTATSTLGGGLDISSGCFAIGGVCLGGSGSGTVGSGTTGQVPYYAANGTTLSATSTLFITSAGRIGIGTTTPAAMLHLEAGTTGQVYVHNNAAAVSAFYLKNDNAVGPGVFVESGYNYFQGDVRIGQTGSGSKLQVKGTAGQSPLMIASSSGSTMLTVLNNGDVGIGVSPSSARLHIDATTAGTGYQLKIDDGATGGFFAIGDGTVLGGSYIPSFYGSATGVNGYGMAFFGQIPTGNDALYGTNEDAAIMLIGQRTAGTSLVTANVLNVRNNSASVMLIKANGNTGIGTTSPAARLHVVSATEQLRLGSDGANFQKFTVDAFGNLEITPGADSLSAFQITQANGSTIMNIDSFVPATTFTGSLAVSTAPGTEWGGFFSNGDSSVQMGVNPTDFAGQIRSSYDGSPNVLSLNPYGGNVGIGTTTPAVALAVVGNAQFTAVTSGAYSSDLNITSDGTLTTSASDIRLKENIAEIATSTLEKLKQLKAYTFTWKTDPDRRTDVGLIAQDVEFVFPELVFTNKTDGFKGVNYSRLSIFLLKGIQEQQIQFEELKKYTSVLKLKEVHTEKLCVGSENDEVCITREDLRNLLQGHAVQNNNTSGGTPTTSSSSGTETAGGSASSTAETVTEPVDNTDSTTPLTTDEQEGGVEGDTNNTEPAPVEETPAEPAPAEPTPAPTPDPAPAPAPAPEPAPAAPTE